MIGAVAVPVGAAAACGQRLHLTWSPDCGWVRVLARWVIKKIVGNAGAFLGNGVAKGVNLCTTGLFAKLA